MQHIDGILKLGHVEDAIFTLRMDSDLNDSTSDEWNRLPIDGRTSCLNQAQLIANFSTRSLGEPSQAVTTVSEPLDRFYTIPHSLRLYRIFIIGMDLDRLVYLVPKWRSATTGRTASRKSPRIYRFPSRTADRTGNRQRCRVGAYFNADAESAALSSKCAYASCDAAIACSRSQSRSSTSSIPTEMRTRSLLTPAANCCSSFSCWCVVDAG